MSSLISKRYIKALLSEIGLQRTEALAKKFSAVSQLVTSNKNFKVSLESGFINKHEQKNIFLGLFDENDKRVKNFIELLIENNRINELENIANELHLISAYYHNQFAGVLLTNSEIDSSTMSHIQTGLQNKLGKTIILDLQKSDNAEIKVTINDLNLELSISKERLESDVISHILKAI